MIVTVDRDKCLLVYPLPDWEELERKLVRLPSMNKVARRIVRIMVGYATEVDMDASGRILVSRELVRMTTVICRRTSSRSLSRLPAIS